MQIKIIKTRTLIYLSVIIIMIITKTVSYSSSRHFHAECKILVQVFQMKHKKTELVQTSTDRWNMATALRPALTERAKPLRADPSRLKWFGDN